MRIKRHDTSDVPTQAEFMEWHGLKDSRGHICVRRLALGRCSLAYLQTGEPKGCSHYSGVFDHSSMYTYGGEPACIVGHEYPQASDRLRKWMGYLDRWPQLDIYIDGSSWYYPGGTFMVVLYKKEVWKRAEHYRLNERKREAA